MGADPFQIDVENLCPHLKVKFQIKCAFSQGMDIVYNNVQSETAETV